MSTNQKQEKNEGHISQPSDSLTAKLDRIEKLLASPQSRGEIVKSNWDELFALLEEALWSDDHWRAAVGCMSYLDGAQAAKLWAAFDSVLTAQRCEDIFDKDVPPQTKLALGAIVRSSDPAFSANLVSSVLEKWSPAKTKQATAASSVAQGLERYFAGESWIPLPMDAKAASWVIPKLVEVLWSRPANRKLKPKVAQQFALWAATELKNTALDELQRRRVLESIFPFAASFDEASRRATFEAAGLQEIVEQAGDSVNQPAEPSLVESGLIAYEPVAEPAELSIVADLPAEPAIEPTVEHAPTKIDSIEQPSQKDEIVITPPKSEKNSVPEPVAPDLTLLSQALELADDIRGEIERRRREETTIRALVSELRHALVTLQDTERKVKQLKKDLKTVTGQKQSALDDFEAVRKSSETLRGTIEVLKTEIRDKQGQIDNLHETLAAAQKEHDFRIDNQVPLRVQAAMDSLGGRIRSVFDNVRSGDVGELDADHAVVLRELFRRLEKMLKEQGVPI